MNENQNFPQTVNWKAKHANRKVFLVKFVWKMGGQPNGALLLSLTTRISGGSGNNHSRKFNIETRSMQWIISILFFILIFNTKQLNADNREELGEFFACICYFYFNFESVLQNWQGNNLHCYDAVLMTILLWFLLITRKRYIERNLFFETVRQSLR